MFLRKLRKTNDFSFPLQERDGKKEKQKVYSLLLLIFEKFNNVNSLKTVFLKPKH